MSDKKSNKRRYKYYKPSLPEKIQEEIERLIKDYPELGYRSIPEFILDAIRTKIKEIKREK